MYLPQKLPLTWQINTGAADGNGPVLCLHIQIELSQREFIVFGNVLI